MIIQLKTFTGTFPRTKAHLLPDNAAQQAVDCDFVDGSLRAIASDDSVAGLSGVNIRSMFVYEGGAASGKTFFWNRDVDAVRSPVVNDAYARFYWSDSTGFYVSRGDIGGNGEPSESNRYKVGVPRPVAALVATQATISLPGVTGYQFELCDERADGTFENSVSISSAGLVFSGTSISLAFTARAASYPTNTGTTTTSKSQQTTGTWYPIGYAYVGAANGAYVPMYGNTQHANSSSSKVVYYETPLSPPSSITIYYGNAGDEQMQVATLYRLGSTYWYGSSSSIAPPTQAGPSNPPQTVTTTIAPVSGPALKMTMLRASGNLTAIVRANSNKTSWPIELPGYSAYLTANGTSYTLTISAKQDYIEHRVYTYTYVNQYGEEGAPADPAEVDCAENVTVNLAYALPPSGYCPCTKIRVYRTATGVAADYLYVGEASVNTVTPVFVDGIRNDELGHTLDTHNYYPPDQGLRGICTMANGMLAGFKGNEIHFMEPYLPYACNPIAIKPLPHRVVGICPFEGGLYVATTTGAHIIQGAAPEYMTDMIVPSAPAGVSKGAITSYNGSIVYASSDGLVMAQGLQASLDLSFKFFTREQWQADFGAKTASMRLDVHDGSLLAWFDDGTPGFLIRFEEEALSLTRLTQGYRASYRHPLADALYVSDGSAVFDFRAGASRESMTWWSKDFILPRPTNFGVMQLIGSGLLTLTIYADGSVKHTEAVTLDDTGATPVRLPSGFMARRWSFSFAGDGEVREVYLATSISELKNV